MNRELSESEVLVEFDHLRRLRAAEGYIELGMYAPADAELEKIDPSCPAVSRVLARKLCTYAGMAKWELMAVVAKNLAQRNPNDGQWAIWWAYSVGRGQAIEAAKAILIRALQIHPNDPRLHYAICCYESRLRHFKTAKRHLARAIQLDSRLKLMALSDEDLEPLWSEIEQFDA